MAELAPIRYEILLSQNNQANGYTCHHNPINDALSSRLLVARGAWVVDMLAFCGGFSLFHGLSRRIYLND